MGQQDLKMIALEERQDFERLVDLYQGFQTYIEQLAEAIRSGTPSNELVSRQQALRLELRDEEHRFTEWHNGELVLNTAIFSLVEEPEDYLTNPAALHAALLLATQKFEYLIRKKERSLRELHEKIALMTTESEARNVTRVEPRSSSGSVVEKAKGADAVTEIGLKWAGRVLKFMSWAESILRTIAK